MKQSRTDEYYMHMALDLSRRGMGRTTPNPMVGCVFVKDGKVVGRGWHDHLGGLHAEAAALAHAARLLGVGVLDDELRGRATGLRLDAHIKAERPQRLGEVPDDLAALRQAGGCALSHVLYLRGCVDGQCDALCVLHVSSLLACVTSYTTTAQHATQPTRNQLRHTRITNSATSRNKHATSTVTAALGEETFSHCRCFD